MAVMLLLFVGAGFLLAPVSSLSTLRGDGPVSRAHGDDPGSMWDGDDWISMLREDDPASMPGEVSVHEAESPEQLASRELQEDDEPVNVLVLGVDKRPDNSLEPQVESTRADTIMLVQITPETGNIELLSIPRDIMVEIQPGVEDRINTAYAYGGVEQTVDVVGRFTGLPIHHYVVVDFQGFEDVVNAMGGVQIDLEEGQYPPGWPERPGLRTLKGHKALVYARWRGTAGGDLDRIQRQQQLVAALRSQAFDWSTVTELPGIIGSIEENVQTDMGPAEMLSFGRTLMKEGRSAQMTATALQGTPEITPDGRQVLDPKYEENESILQDFRH